MTQYAHGAAGHFIPTEVGIQSWMPASAGMTTEAK